MNRKILSLLLLLIAANSVFCQEKSGIRGHIKCKETKEILTGVTVATDSLIGTYTDINGFYELPLPSGTYSIKFSFIGYITETKEVTIGDSFKTLDINLKIDNKILDAVVVSSARKDANVRDFKMSVQTIDMVRIKKIPSLIWARAP